MAQLARTKLVSHGLAPSGNYGISSSIKVHSGAANVGESSPSPIKLMWTYKDLNDASGRGHEGNTVGYVVTAYERTLTFNEIEHPKPTILQLEGYAKHPHLRKNTTYLLTHTHIPIHQYFTWMTFDFFSKQPSYFRILLSAVHKKLEPFPNRNLYCKNFNK